MCKRMLSFQIHPLIMAIFTALLLLPIVTPFVSSRTPSPFLKNAIAFRKKSTQLHSSSALSSSEQQQQTIIPITILSGFLGSGKTTLLSHLLNNNNNEKFALIVNDVASINIDSKLLMSPNAPDTENIINLSNGCACCSLSDDVLQSVSQLLTMSDLRDDGGYDRIVMECSGISDPDAIRALFQEAEMYGMPIMERICLESMVTVIDASTFQSYLKTKKKVSVKDAPELYYTSEEEQRKWKEEWEDFPPKLLEALGAAAKTYGVQDNEAENEGVSSLLISQVEIADIILINKCDLVSDETLEQIQEIVQALNPHAVTIRTEHGVVETDTIFPTRDEDDISIAELGPIDDHRELVSAVKQSSGEIAKSEEHDHSHEHGSACDDPDCTDPSHSHSHSHEHSAACDDPDCTDASHSHSHAHACDDPNCDDPSHSHSTKNSHHYITSFVYAARKPFHPLRLSDFLNNLSASPEILRSKGFIWLANSHIAANYWSHAGFSYDVKCLGRWWATLGREGWPEEATPVILSDFDSSDHNEEKFPKSVGDRRQEVVFIGNSKDMDRDKIIEELNACLLNDEEYADYVKNMDKEDSLKEMFGTLLEVVG